MKYHKTKFSSLDLFLWIQCHAILHYTTLINSRLCRFSSHYLCFMMRSSLASLCKPKKKNHQQNDTKVYRTALLSFRRDFISDFKAEIQLFDSEHLLKYLIINNEPVWRHTFSPAMSWYQVACPGMPSEEADSCNHETAPQEGANAADQHRVLKQGQDLRQILTLAVWFRGTPSLWVWTANRWNQILSHDKFSSLLWLDYKSDTGSNSNIFLQCPFAHWWQIHGGHSAFLLQLRWPLLWWSSIVSLVWEQRCQGCVGHYSLSSFGTAAPQAPHTTPGKAVCMLKRSGITKASFIKFFQVFLDAI